METELTDALSRRDFLAATAVLVTAPCTAFAGLPTMVTTAMLEDGTFAIVGVDARGAPVFAEPLPARGHGITRRPGTDELVILARRPGRFGFVIDRRSGAVQARFEPPENRHFCGHAAFSGDGRLLYTTENAFDEERGVIGIWDTSTGYRRIGEVDSAGIGPHDAARAAGSERIWIANGGILTHPDSGRAKLNIPTMAPSLALFDPARDILDTVLTLPADLHKLSMRHLAAGPEIVCVAMQDQGPEGEKTPLICLRTRRRETRLLHLPDAVTLKARGYCGDVAMDPLGKVVGAGFPRGGFFAFWAVEDGRPLGVIAAEDGCGIATGHRAGGFRVSTGTGRIGHIAADRDRLSALWFTTGGVAAHDNHLLAP